MKNTKVERAVYAAWDYELEIDHLNEMSEQGWQLVRGGCFRTKYERKDGVVYRYQLDHNVGIKDRVRYIDTFREQGWEYVNSTFNGWHYFRKLYDPAKPQEEYEIYTDRPSMVEMAGRLSKLMLALSLLLVVVLIGSVCSMITAPSMAQIGIVVEIALALVLTAIGCVRMRAVGVGEKPTYRFPLKALISVVLVCFLWSMLFSIASDRLMPVFSRVDNKIIMEYDVKLPDWVKINKGGRDDLQASITDEAGEVRQVREGYVFLMPGEYSVVIEAVGN